MKKRNFWLTGIVLAALASTALLLGCPTGDTSWSPGFYVGDTPTDVSGQTGANLIEKSLSWLKTNAADDTTYTILLGEDITVTTHNPLFSANYANGTNGVSLSAFYVIDSTALNGKDRITLVVKADSKTRTIKLGGQGTLFQVGIENAGDQPSFRDITLVLENITIKGRRQGVDSAATDNNAPLLYCAGGGKMNIGNNAVITGNTASYSGEARGGGILVRRGTLTMDGGTITDIVAVTTNTSSDVLGGALCVIDYRESAFIMNGGSITGNQAQAFDSSARGGAIFCSSGSFKMTGGSITRNHAQTNRGNALGGAFGQWVDATVELLGGTIKDNTANSTTGAGIPFPGLRVTGSFLTLGGNVEIGNPIVISGVPFNLASDFNPAGQIQIDFNAAAASSTYSNRVLLKWADAGKNDPLPVAKIKLGNYAATATLPLPPITGSIDPATGVFTPAP